MKTILALIFLLLAVPANAQMKSWTDEHGVVHYESGGSKTTASTSTAPATAQSPTQAAAPIFRMYAGVSLEHSLSFFKTEWWAVRVIRDPQGGDIYRADRRKWPADAQEFAATFIGDAMAGFLIEFPRSRWDSLISMASEKYGKPSSIAYDRQVWRDGKTFLQIQKDYRSSKVWLLDIDRGSRLLQMGGSSLPGF